MFDDGVPDHQLLQLGEQYAELLAALDRGEALCRALALLAGDSRVVWAAQPNSVQELTIDEVRAGQTLTERFIELSGTGGEVEGLEWLHTFSD